MNAHPLCLRVSLRTLLIIAAGWSSLLSVRVCTAQTESSTQQIIIPVLPHEMQVPVPFRLSPATFPVVCQEKWRFRNGVLQTHVKFESAVRSSVEASNIVHGNYYRSPLGGKRPGILLLHYLDRDVTVTCWIGQELSRRGFHVLMMYMPHYGPRRGSGKCARNMISPDVEATTENIRQAVLDARRSVAWLREREEVDADHVHLVGISLGGIVGSLAFQMEPRLQRACVLLAGGNLGETIWNHAQLKDFRNQWLQKGKSQDEFMRMADAYDPAKASFPAPNREVLFINAKYDRVFPVDSAKALHKPFPERTEEWLPTGHVSSVFYITTALDLVEAFLQKP